MKYDQDHKPLHVLLVDDDEDDSQLLREAIHSYKTNLALHSIADGEELMSYLTLCNGNTPDLIFMDLNMPRKNGMECLVEMRTDTSLNNTVIAIYSASSSKKEVDNAFLAGANIFITKPNTYEALKKVVADVLSINMLYSSPAMRKEHFMMLR